MLKRILLATSLLGAFAASASAAIILENPGSLTFQQTLNNPCVIGDPSCKQPAGFGETIIPANTSPYDLFSPVYTVAQIVGIVGSTTFRVGIDVNTTTQPLATERLDLFATLINGAQDAANTYDPATPGTQLFTVNNGNGNSDELLTGFSLAGLAGTTTVQFHVIVNNATDGREEFFLVAANSPVGAPEPASLALLGAGLVGVGFVRRRRSSTIA